MTEIKFSKTDFLLVPIEKVVPHPKNNNKHPDSQVDALAKLISAHGFRTPLVVSNLSGFLVAGHCRLLAAQKLKMKKVPVIRQDFESEAEEYQFLTSDNAVATWAQIDMEMVNQAVQEIPGVDIDLLGIKDFELPESDSDYDEEDEQEKIEKYTVQIETPNKLEAKQLYEEMLDRGLIARLM